MFVNKGNTEGQGGGEGGGGEAVDVFVNKRNKDGQRGWGWGGDRGRQWTMWQENVEEKERNVKIKQIFCFIFK